MDLHTLRPPADGMESVTAPLLTEFSSRPFLCYFFNSRPFLFSDWETTAIMLTSASVAMIATQAILMAFAIMAVSLRINVRLHKSPPLRADDYFILVALVSHGRFEFSSCC